MKPSTARPGALSVGQVLRFEKPDGNSVCSAAGGLSRVGRSISRACEQARDQGNAELSSLGLTRFAWTSQHSLRSHEEVRDEPEQLASGSVREDAA